MGCASSNQEDAKDVKNKNGNAGKTGAGGAGGPNGEQAGEQPVAKQNPYLSLTPKDIFSLKMSYKGIRRAMEETGIAMFIKMFSSNEELKQYFEKLKDKDNAVLIKSQILLDHATVVMEAIDTTVTELDDAEKTHANLKKLGVEHKARGVKESHLDQIKTPFLKSVEETLGDRYSDRMRNIYEVFIDYVIKTMIEGYNS